MRINKMNARDAPAKAESCHAIAQSNTIASHRLEVGPKRRKEDAPSRVSQQNDAHHNSERNFVIDGGPHLIFRGGGVEIGRTRCYRQQGQTLPSVNRKELALKRGSFIHDTCFKRGQL